MSHLAVGLGERSGEIPWVLARYTPANARLTPALGVPEEAMSGVWPTVKALTRSERLLYVGTEPFGHLGEVDPSVLLFRREDFAFEGRFRLAGLRELRGLCWWDGSLYAVSGGTGEIVGFPAVGRGLGRNRFIWRPPREAGEAVPMRLHSMILHTCDYYVSVQGCVDEPASGMILNVTRSTVVRRGLCEPGRMLSLGRSLLVCERGGVDRGSEEPKIAAGLTPRGLAVLGEQVHLALDDQRGELEMGSFDLSTGTIEERRSLGIPGRLVSDLVAVEEAGGWPDQPDVDWLNTLGEPV